MITENRSRALASLLLAFGILACAAPDAPPTAGGTASPVAAAAPAPAAPLGVLSDTGRLHATLVLVTGDERFKGVGFGGGHHPFFRVGSAHGRLKEQTELNEILERESVRVLDVADVLQSAVKNARREGALADWLRETFPHSADRAVARLDEIDARSLLSRRDDHFYLKNEAGELDPLFPSPGGMHWTRDFAAMTPEGIVIGNSRYLVRSIENDLARFMFRYADELRDVAVVFDAEAEDVYLDGGDLIVLDERTILLGVDNRSSREAAVKLARQLDMDVLAVAMPEFAGTGSVRRTLLHLDTTLNVVDHKTVVALPFFYEEAWTGKHPVGPILGGLAKQAKALAEARPNREYFSESEDIALILAGLSKIGWVTRYAASTGEAEELGTKIVDHLRAEGWQVVFVGGEQGDLPLERYLMERVLYELSWQGGNVVQLEPGRVIAYEHNVHTNEALRAAGVEVVTFSGDLLSQGSGGPHCLLMPLSREGRETGLQVSKLPDG